MLISKKILVISFTIIMAATGFSLASDDFHSKDLPKAFTSHRLRADSEPLLEWHVKNEARTALTFAGVMGASYLIASALPRWVPARALMAGAGVAIDSLTAHDTPDFMARQLIRLASMGVQYQFSNQLQNSWTWFAASQLLPEIPNLIQGGREWHQQQQAHHDGLNQHIPLGVKDSHKFDLYIKNTKASSSIQLHFTSVASPKSQQPSQAQSPLGSVTDLMSAHQLDWLLLIPGYQNQKPVLELRAQRGQKVELLTLAFPKVAPLTKWATDHLLHNKTTAGETSVLYPLSPCIVRHLQQHFSQPVGTGGELVSVSCTDLTTRTVGGNVLQAIPLEPSSYLLADHGLSQATRAPDLWLIQGGIKQLQANDFVQLEEKLIPGNERGLWRLVTSARSLTYHLAGHYIITKATKSTEPTQSEEDQRLPQKDQRQSQKDQRQSDLSEDYQVQDTPPEQQDKMSYRWDGSSYSSYWQVPENEDDIAALPGQIVVVLSYQNEEGVKVSTDIANVAAKGPTHPLVSDETLGYSQNVLAHRVQGNTKLIQLFVTAGKDYSVDMFPDNHIHWLNRADKIITVDNADTLRNGGLPSYRIPEDLRGKFEPSQTLLEIAEDDGFTSNKAIFFSHTGRIPADQLANATVPDDEDALIKWLFESSRIERGGDWQKAIHNFIYKSRMD